MDYIRINYGIILIHLPVKKVRRSGREFVEISNEKKILLINFLFIIEQILNNEYLKKFERFICK